MYELVKDYKETAPVDDININMPARLVRNICHERGFKLNMFHIVIIIAATIF
jgi:hypothetical protein